jgi:hypothetical protein
MPTNIQIIHTEDFIRAKPDGSLDFAASRNLLMELVDESATATTHHVLLDTRQADIRLSSTEIFELAARVAHESALRGRSRLALLVPSEKGADARFFETVSTNQGANVRAFFDFEAAITWLIMKERR